MKELPILFSTIMVLANMEDRKGMTRRTRGLKEINKSPGNHIFSHFITDDQGRLVAVFKDAFLSFLDTTVVSPYGKPGDILWVRESFLMRTLRGEMGKYGYKADFKHSWKGPLKWKPSIHMPKEAARLWLQVTDVRIERLQNITEADAIAEGVEKLPGSTNHTRFDYKHYKYGTYDVSAQVSFRTLWEIVNGTDSWGHNPWVWVIKYKVLSKTGKPETFPAYVKEAV